MQLLVIALVLIAVHANASDFKQFFVDGSGKKLDAAQAINASLKGSEILKCQTVEAKVSKSGTSLSLHNVKKPKKD
jgi:hypothetical protein